MTSNAAHESQEEKSLVDFLYVDKPRLAVLSAQLFADGHIVGVKKSSQSGVDSVMKVKGGIPGVAAGETSSVDKLTESIERQFDATWSSPLNVIGELNSRGLIVDNPGNAAFGQFVLAKGAIHVADVRMLQKLWAPVIKSETAKELQAAKNEAERKRIRQQASDNSTNLAVVEVLPHSLQFRINGDDYACWATLDAEQLTISPADLAFKHGPSIPGQWFAIGVLDARPDSHLKALEDSLVNVTNPLHLGMTQIMTVLRQAFGRPETDFGFTPLVIYRPID